jgi:hypothetical protein
MYRKLEYPECIECNGFKYSNETIAIDNEYSERILSAQSCKLLLQITEAFVLVPL